MAMLELLEFRKIFNCQLSCLCFIFPWIMYSACYWNDSELL